MGQRAFKASLLARHRRNKVEPTLHLLQGSLGSEMAHRLTRLPWVLEKVANSPALSISLLNAMASSRRGGGFWGARGLRDLGGFISCPTGEEPGTSMAGSLQATPCLSPEPGAATPHLGWAVGVAISLASLKPFTHPFSLPSFPPRPGACSPSKPNQSANKFRWESLKIPLQFS